MLLGDDEKDSSEQDSSKSGSDNKEEQDDNEEESDDSSQETEEKDTGSGKDDKEEGEDVIKQYIKDPNSVPKELRPAVKKLLGVYTRRMQAASLSVKKAEAFDQLVMDQEFRSWMEDRQKGVLNKSKASSRDKEDDSDEEEDDKPLTKKDLMKILSEDRKKTDEEKQLEVRKAEIRAEAKKFKEDHPDWKLYKDDLQDLVDRHPTLSWEEAYKLITNDTSTSKKDDIEVKRRSNISKPNRHTGKEVQKKGKMSITEAFNLAKKSIGLK